MTTFGDVASQDLAEVEVALCGMVARFAARVRESAAAEALVIEGARSGVGDLLAVPATDTNLTSGAAR